MSPGPRPHPDCLKGPAQGEATVDQEDDEKPFRLQALRQRRVLTQYRKDQVCVATATSKPTSTLATDSTRDMALDRRCVAGIVSGAGRPKSLRMEDKRFTAPDAPEIIDDLRFDFPLAVTGNDWALISDSVMGGASAGRMSREIVEGREAIRMRGGVSLKNNGGFLQVALDLGDAGGEVDARGWTGLRLDVYGNDQLYNLHLRTSDIRRPWESYRQSFRALATWTGVSLPLDGFIAHRTELPLNPARLRRIGIVAIGREFEADIAIADIRFYAAP